MKQDVTFRSAVFGGFRKRDVMEYIGDLQQAAVETQGAMAEQQQRLTQAEARVKELEAELAQARNAREELAVANASYAERVLQAEQENAALSQKAEQAEESAARLKAIEAQLGGMMLDAQIYSEQVVQEAKSRVTEISSDYCRSVQGISGDIAQFTQDMHAFSAEMSATVSSLVQKLVDMSQKLEKSAVALRGDSERAAQQPAPAMQPPAPQELGDTPSPSEPVNPPLRMLSSDEAGDHADGVHQEKNHPFAVDISKIEDVDVYSIRAAAREELFSSSAASTSYHVRNALSFGGGHGTGAPHSLES